MKVFNNIKITEHNDVKNIKHTTKRMIMKIEDKLDIYLIEYKYQKHKVSHGRKRSEASKLTGTKKLEYIKKLKKKRKERRNNPAEKLKQKRYLKKHKKTAKYKRTKAKYKQYHK